MDSRYLTTKILQPCRAQPDQLLMHGFELPKQKGNIKVETVWPERLQLPKSVTQMFIRAMINASFKLVQSSGRLNQTLKKYATVFRVPAPNLFPGFVGLPKSALIEKVDAVFEISDIMSRKFRRGQAGKICFVDTPGNRSHNTTK